MSQLPPDAQARLQDAKSLVSDRLGDVWWAFMLRGLLALLLGCLALFWPTTSISWLLRIAGLFLIIDGLAVVFSFRQLDMGRSGTAQGVITLVLGVILLLLPETSIRLAFVLLGIWALISGAGYLWNGWSMDSDDPERGTALTLGGLGAIAGLVLLFWPGTGVVAIGWLIAIAAFIVAAVLISVALRLKNVKRRVDERTRI